MKLFQQIALLLAVAGSSAIPQPAPEAAVMNTVTVGENTFVGLDDIVSLEQGKRCTGLYLAHSDCTPGKCQCAGNYGCWACNGGRMQCQPGPGSGVCWT
ncbi:hypothetical protein F5Y06DRAFT_302183 [Hypoxylon sp. FL0890]|nr:hypothetical protein F5Y06DRAFT_302183 [Hypoxylon sp. FL0890]